jgi:hypothetical protein
VCCRSAPSLRFNPMPPRTTQKSYRPRVSHRIMVGNLANTFACVASGAEGVEYHRVMKPSSGKRQLGWFRWNTRRAQGGQDQHPSSTDMGLDASHNMHVPLEGRGRIFFLTSPLIGQLTSAWRLPKYTQVAQDIVFCGLDCGLKICLHFVLTKAVCRASDDRTRRAGRLRMLAVIPFLRCTHHRRRENASTLPTRISKTRPQETWT